MGIHVEDILRRRGLVVRQGVEVLEGNRAEIEDEGRVLAGPLVFRVEPEDGVVVGTQHRIAVQPEDVHLEHVDAAAFACGGVGLHIDAGELRHVGVEVRQVMLGDVQVLLAEGFREVEFQGVPAVGHGDALGDGLWAMRHLRAGEVLLVVERLGQRIDADVLQDVALRLVRDGGGVERRAEGEALEDRVPAEVEGVQHRDERQGASPAVEAEGVVADGSDRDPLGRVAREAVDLAHPDVFEVEFRGVYVVLLVGGDEIAADLLVDFYAGPEPRCQDRRTKEFLHCLKLFIKCVVPRDVASVRHRGGIVRKDRDLQPLAVVRQPGVEGVGSEDDTVGVPGCGFCKSYAIGLCEQVEVGGLYAARLGQRSEGGSEGFSGDLVVQGRDDLAVGEDRIARIELLQVQGDEVGNPPLAMDDVGGPAQLFHGLQHAAGEEDGPLVVVFEELAVLVEGELAAFEVVFVVDEINLHAGGGYRGDLDDQRPVEVADDDVQAGEADDLVQLVLPFVDAAVTGHEDTDLTAALHDALGQFPPDRGEGALRKERKDLRVDE